MGGYDRAPQVDKELKCWKIGECWPTRTTNPQGLPGAPPPHPGTLTVPTAPAREAGRGRHCTAGSRVARPGGPALPAVPEILPPAHATRARNAPAGRTWCGGERRRRGGSRSVARLATSTTARPLAGRLRRHQLFLRSRSHART